MSYTFKKELKMDVFNVFKLTILGILLCFNEVECTCYTNYQQCYTTYKSVSRPQSFSVADWTNFCSAADKFDTCLKNDVTTCGPNVTKPQEYTNYVSYAADSKASCKVVTCATTSQKCTASLTANPKCFQNVNGLTIAEGVDCCKIGAATTQCVRDCGDTNIISSYPALQQADALCQGYSDYCPQMSDCFDAIDKNDGFIGAANVCKNVASFITCIEQKCANKPQIGQQSLAKIKEVFTGICGVVGKYPAIASCTDFTSCIDKTPSLPGTIFGVPSHVSARNTDRWCQIAKSYVGCGETAANSCSLGSGFTTDVSNVKTSTDNACTGVRGPCPSVSNCLATLQGNQGAVLQFKTTCPNIPAFVTCTNNALTTCGDGSRVKAEYSLEDIKNLYNETCNAMIDGLYQCNLTSSCLNLQLPSYIGDMIDEFSDQTSWCRKLNRMLKCTTDVSTSCHQPKDVHDKFMVLYDKVKKLCPIPVFQPVTDDNGADGDNGADSDNGADDDNGAGSTRVTGVLVITAFLMIFI